MSDEHYFTSSAAYDAMDTHDRGVISVNPAFIRTSDRSTPLVLNPDDSPIEWIIHNPFTTTKPEPTEEERQEMSWTNPEAKSIAQEILSEQRREAMRAEVTTAVSTLQEMIADASEGAVFSFRKTSEDSGKHYWYACVKCEDGWHTTASRDRYFKTDESFIEWLVSLEAWRAERLALTAGESRVTGLPATIDATAVEGNG